jgi:hypothetical protein
VLTGVAMAGIIAFVVLYALLYLMVLVPWPNPAYATFVNDSAVARLNVSNFVPQVVGVIVDDSTPSPPNEIDLVSGFVRKVWCNGTVIDFNGKDDIMACNATLFFTGNRSGQSNDMNEHYSNRSCRLIRSGINNKTFTCSFAVWFFANNGTWWCNMSAWDNGTANLNHLSAFNSSLDSTKTNSLYALAVPPVVEYGQLVINQTSPADIITNVTNTGNMNIDLQLHGYGGTASPPTENNLSMKCALGTINITNERFALASGTAYASMTNLSGRFANPNDLNTFNLLQRKSETINSTRNTYWKVKVPRAGVKGKCNGTIVFSSVIDD